MKVEIYLFLLVTWPQCRSVTWLCGWGPLNLRGHPANFRVHRPYGTENNGVCNISSDSNSISNSNSNAEVLMPGFTNGPLFYWLLIKRNFRAKALTIMINIRTLEHCTEHWWSLKPLPIVIKNISGILDFKTKRQMVWKSIDLFLCFRLSKAAIGGVL